MPFFFLSREGFDNRIFFILKIILDKVFSLCYLYRKDDLQKGWSMDFIEAVTALKNGEGG